MVRCGSERNACSISFSRVSEAGERILWKESGAPSGRGGIGGNVHIEEIGNGAFVLDVPAVSERADEIIVQ
eukprot:172443-Pleurochrysis_carterae.AAC.2